MADEYEYQTRMLAISDKIGEELAALENDGWEILPGAAPVAIYQLRRIKGRFASVAGRGGMSIDESKVYVIGPNGERKG